jgi:carbon-monoxide dehydrogenase large subunit
LPYIGSPIRRIEDHRLLTGAGEYSGDIAPERLAHLAVARSPLAHARIASIDLGPATTMPDVLLAWTATDLPQTAQFMSTSLPPEVAGHRRPVLALDEVHYVGEGVAIVVAEDRYRVRDAVEKVAVEWEELRPVVTARLAAGEGASLVHEDRPGNIAREAQYGFGDVDPAFASAPVIVREHLEAGRVCAMAMEPRAVTASYDASTGRLTVWTSTQGVFLVRNELARLLNVDVNLIDVIAHDVGGAFGAKGLVYPEEVLVSLAAMHLKRPVQWVAGRGEDTATSVHGHGTEFELELAATQEGELLGLRATILHDLGPYAAPGYDQTDNIATHMMSAYRIPAMEVHAKVVFTNATPTGFIRGGSRPLGNFAIERMMDRLARRLELDPVEVRRRNLIPFTHAPYDTKIPRGDATMHYDSSDYATLLEQAVKTLDRHAWRNLRSESSRIIGTGVACCVESSGYGNREPARLEIDHRGVATVFVSSTAQGQSHATMAAMIAADRLGWPLARVRVVQGDSRDVPTATFTAGSRTTIHMGNAVAIAARSAREQLLARACERLEAAIEDLSLVDGVVSVTGSPAKSIRAEALIGQESLIVPAEFETRTPWAYPSSCHAAAVEIDPELGTVEILKYVMVCDSGTVINPQNLDGQLVGGYVHGIGYALFEEAVFAADGSLLTASLIDYPIRLHFDRPSDFNPEGVKGAGESGTVPVPAAIANAVEDALIFAGIRQAVHRIPITPDRTYELFANALRAQELVRAPASD